MAQIPCPRKHEQGGHAYTASLRRSSPHSIAALTNDTTVLFSSPSSLTHRSLHFARLRRSLSGAGQSQLPKRQSNLDQARVQSEPSVVLSQPILGRQLGYGNISPAVGSFCGTSKLIRCQDEAAYNIAVCPTWWLCICLRQYRSSLLLA